MSVLEKHCRHHEVEPGKIMERGSGHRCALGIDIRGLVGGPDRGWLKRHPCYLPNKGEPGFVACDKAEPFTREELAEDNRIHKALVARTLASLDLMERVKRERQGGEFPCPAPGCTGTLAIAYYPGNGHTRGVCTADGCYRWIE